MIVKRMVESLRRQDWAMVGIEFVLVVVGVLLAFQINEFANERAAARERGAATLRLLDEAERNVAYLKLAVRNQQQLVDDLNYSMAKLQGGGIEPPDQARATRAFARVRTLLPLAPPSAVYDDVVSSGELGQLDDPGLRAAIGDFQATLSFEERLRNLALTALPVLAGHDAFTYRFEPAGLRRERLVVDFDALARDTDLQEKLVMLAEDHRALLLLRRRALTGSEKMCVALGKAVDRACNLDLPPPTFERN